MLNYTLMIITDIFVTSIVFRTQWRHRRLGVASRRLRVEHDSAESAENILAARVGGFTGETH